jgi:hypothetical protein
MVRRKDAGPVGWMDQSYGKKLIELSCEKDTKKSISGIPYSEISQLPFSSNFDWN